MFYNRLLSKLVSKAMIKEIFSQIITQYEQAYTEPLKEHSLAQVITKNLRDEMEACLGDHSRGLRVSCSAGVGAWAHVPWGVVLDPMVTNSATKGYYVGYLFSPREKSVFLTLNQGATAVREEFGSQALSVLRDRAALMRARLKDFDAEFDLREIALGYNAGLPIAYEAGHALGKAYLLDEMPDNSILKNDLRRIVEAYLTLTFRGGLDPSPELANETVNNNSLMEVRRYQMHRRIERNATASASVKKFHGTTCQGCGFNFEEKYGDVGEGYIEAHHLKPLSAIEEGKIVEYSIENDFAVLCANCHRMIHRMDDPSDIGGLRRLFKSA